MKDTDYLSKMKEGMLGEFEADMIESVFELFDHHRPYKVAQKQEQDNEDQSPIRS